MSAGTTRPKREPRLAIAGSTMSALYTMMNVPQVTMTIPLRKKSSIPPVSGPVMGSVTLDGMYQMTRSSALTTVKESRSAMPK